MIFLLAIAFISGLVTILAPCIWPLLPIVLSASSSGGKNKPLGITLGITVSFAIVTLSISYLVRFIHLDPDIFRLLAVVIIGLLGLFLLIPSFSVRTEVLLSKISGRINPDNTINKNGFWGGIITGMALGVVWSPCAGPILAAVATLASTARVSWQIILVTIFYVAGIGGPLFLLAKAGNSLFLKVKFLNQNLEKIQKIFGVVMVLTALAIFTNFDKLLEVKLLGAFPKYSSFLVRLESNPEVEKQLNSLEGKNQKTVEKVGRVMNNLQTDVLPDYGLAPDFVGVNRWLNTENGQSLTLRNLRGKVVLVDFWTYTCINCLRTLPYVTSWYSKYRDQGFLVIGVHTPEFEFEKKTTNVEMAIRQYGITYPVGQDNDYATWNAFGNSYWPAEYLIDANGHIRRTHFGEGEYGQMEKAIQNLLLEKGAKITNSIDNRPDQTLMNRISPETYLGSKRAEFYYPDGSLGNGEKTFNLTGEIPENSFSLGGDWTISDEFARASPGAVVNYHFQARKVYIILRPETDQTPEVKIYLDGQIIKPDASGQDVREGKIIIKEDRLYNIVDLKDRSENHFLKLEFPQGKIEVFTFTFG